MAGSWQHMTTGTGRLRNNESFAEMVENLGDAYEAAEECYGMIWWLARAYAGRGAGRDEIAEFVHWANRHYKEGVKLGGRQRPR